MTINDSRSILPKTRLFGSLLSLLTAFYLSLWYGGVVPVLLESNVVDYLTIGLAAAFLFFIGGLVLIIDIKVSKFITILIGLANITLFLINIISIQIWWIVLLGIAQGFLLGILIKSVIRQQNLNNSKIGWTFGMFISFVSYFIPFRFQDEKVDRSLFLHINLGFEYSGLLYIILASLVSLLIFLALQPRHNIELSSKDNNFAGQSGLLFFSIKAIFSIVLLIEVSFFFWALVLKDQSQGVIYQLTIPLTLLIFITLRFFAFRLSASIFSIGWLFVFSIVLTLSLGMFYTFDFTPLFFIGFSCALVYYLKIITSLTGYSISAKQMGNYLMLIAFVMVISGLFIQNHIEYIISIKMPVNVIHLSARQAWIKELATFSALLIIITGTLFLKRRRLKFKIVPFVVLAFIGLSSCSYKAAKPTITEIINEYEVFTDTIGVLTKGVWEISTDSIRAAQKEKYIQLIAKIQTLDSTDLSLNDNINKDLLLLIMENYLNDLEFESHLMPINAEGGFLTEIVYSIQYADTKNSENKKAYINKLNALPEFLAHFQKLMQKGIIKGKVAPKIVTQRCIELAAPFLAINNEENIFLSPCGDNDSLKQVVKVIVKEKIAPAYQSFYTFLSKEYMIASKEAPGISQLPGGKKFYEMKTSYYTTLPMTPHEVFTQGEKEVKRIRSEMEAIIERINFKGSFEEFVVFLRKDPRFYAKTPRELLYRASWIAKKMEGKLPLYFNQLPRMPFTVEEVSPSIAPNYTSGRYSEGSYTTGKPGAYWVNTYKLESRPLYALPALTLHEAVPGHHLQIMLSKELKNIPKFRQDLYISAFGEGWGLYAEYLGKEAGMYETDFEDFGRLTYEMWRACRLVVDPGLHYKGWSRQQAVDFMASNTALSLHEVNTEIDRYIGWPGQAVSYKIGELKIRQLRKTAEDSLGNKFNIKAFHDLILSNGAVGLSTLDLIVQKYIIDTKADI